MTTVVLERVQTPYSQLHSGAQLSLRDLDAYRIALCGPGNTAADKIAFVCQYADEYQEKVLLLDESGVFCPRHHTKKSGSSANISQFLTKYGMIDVFRAATFGARADCYAQIYEKDALLREYGYQHVFVASDKTVDRQSRYAVLFPKERAGLGARLLQQLYDYDVTILGMVQGNKG